MCRKPRTVPVIKDLSNKTSTQWYLVWNCNILESSPGVTSSDPAAPSRQKQVHSPRRLTQAGSHRISSLSPPASPLRVNQLEGEEAAFWAEPAPYLDPVSCCKRLCCSRSSLRADRLAEKSTGRDVSRFQLRSSFSRKDKEKKACGKKRWKKDLCLCFINYCCFHWVVNVPPEVQLPVSGTWPPPAPAGTRVRQRLEWWYGSDCCLPAPAARHHEGCPWERARSLGPGSPPGQTGRSKYTDGDTAASSQPTGQRIGTNKRQKGTGEGKGWQDTCFPGQQQGADGWLRHHDHHSSHTWEGESKRNVFN